MTCYHPIKAYSTPTGVVFNELRRHDITGQLELPCGRCLGCRLARAQEWEMRCMHEASQWRENCFVTLTYADENLPPGHSLHHAHFQQFMRRLRKRRGTVRFYMCGEYGDQLDRPHYHACLFGTDFHDRKPQGKSASGQVFYSSGELTDLWPHGFSTVQDLTRSSAGYTARYIMQKQLGKTSEETYRRVNPETGEITPITPPYNVMSKKPGIGATWFDKYHGDIFKHDHAIADGAQRKVPRYYDKLLERKQKKGETNYDTDAIEHKRQIRGRMNVQDQTAERLKVREQVATARAATLKRN